MEYEAHPRYAAPGVGRPSGSAGRPGVGELAHAFLRKGAGLFGSKTCDLGGLARSTGMTETKDHHASLARGPDRHAEAADWLAAMVADDVSDAQIERFDRWLADPD